jgi:hypothetical protein
VIFVSECKLIASIAAATKRKLVALSGLLKVNDENSIYFATRCLDLNGDFGMRDGARST